jgi:hypothetical protein
MSPQDDTSDVAQKRGGGKVVSIVMFVLSLLLLLLYTPSLMEGIRVAASGGSDLDKVRMYSVTLGGALLAGILLIVTGLLSLSSRRLPLWFRIVMPLPTLLIIATCLFIWFGGGLS